MSSQHLTTFAVVGALVVFGLYRRFKRAVGRREVTRWTAFRAALLSLFAIGFVALVVGDAVSGQLLLATGGVLGLLAGAGVGVAGIATASFEREDGDLFVTTHPYVSVGVLALVVLRIAYRYAAMYGAFGNATPTTGNGNSTGSLATFHDPLTLGVVGILLAYYALTYLSMVWADRTGAFVA